MNFHRLSILPVLAALTACASTPADRGMHDVQELVANRGGISIDSGSSAEADTHLHGLLAQPISAESATHIALLRNPTMQSVYARLGISQADLLEVSRLSNPTLSLSTLIPNHGGPIRIDYGLAQNFTELLFQHTRTQIAEGEMERAKEIAGRQIQSLAADVTAAWYELVAARQVAAMRAVIAKSSHTAADLAQRFFDAGNITELDLLQQQSAATKAELESGSAQARADAAHGKLNQLMGLSAEQARWQTTDQLPLPVNKEDELTVLRDLAKQYRLDLYAKQRELKTLGTVHDLAQRWRWLGIVNVGVQGERDNDGTHLIGPAVSLQLPIFHQGQASVLRTQAQLEQAQAELAGLQTEIDNAVTVAQGKVAEARSRAERYRSEQIPQREHIVARTQEYVNYMLVGVFELIRAQQDEYDAYQAYLEALRDYWLARVDLSRAIGAHLPSDDQIGEGAAAAIEIPETAPPSDHEHHMHHSTAEMQGMNHDATDMKGMSGMDHSMNMKDMPAMNHGTPDRTQ
jgi:cobalt-zinc-cadmium efflux system outer membrane protein